MGYDLRTTDTPWNADDIRTNSMGVQPVTQMGRRMGEMDNTLFDGAFLWCYALLRKFLFVYILLIINYISFTKLLAQQTCNKNQKNYFPRI